MKAILLTIVIFAFLTFTAVHCGVHWGHGDMGNWGHMDDMWSHSLNYLEKCDNFVCLNGGKCVGYRNNQTCKCLPGFSGTNCSVIVNLCDPNPCQNGASCAKVGYSNYICSCNTACNSQYTGKNCEFVNNCASNPCQNGGSCNNINSTFYACTCPRGFTGKNCEVKIDLCSPNPCQNGASCSNVGYFDYVCSCNTDCSSKYVGKNCDIENKCLSNPCQNGAECFTRNSTAYICKCPRGYSGNNCEIQVNLCDSNPCKNGGTCVNLGVFNYKCTCAANTSGANCQCTIKYTSVFACKRSGCKYCDNEWCCA